LKNLLRCGFVVLLAASASNAWGAPASPHASATDPFAGLIAWAGERGSSAVVIARRGEILAERRWDRPASRVEITADGWPVEDVASVQKSVTAVLIGVALEQGHLRLEESVTRWLGPGWSRAPRESEAAITLRHLLTMTSGLREDLAFEADAGTRWRYNTPAYCRLLDVLAAASGMELETFTRLRLTGPLGMQHSRWSRRSGPAAAANPWGFLTTAHDLVRFGRMILAGGRPVLKGREWCEAMLRPSQSLNPDYGYLWWLNSQRVPGRPGRRLPGAPAELLAAEGARDCKLYLLPARDVVIVRLGEPAGAGFATRFWELFPASNQLP